HHGHVPAAEPAPPPAAPPREREIRIISHCSLFYWWPVWAISLILFLITAATGEYMVTVPPGTTAVKAWKDDDKGVKRDVYLLPVPDPNTKKTTLLPIDKSHPELVQQPRQLWMSTNKNLGVMFVTVLLLVIVITNIPLRGLWSVIVIVMIVSLTIIFAL